MDTDLKERIPILNNPKQFGGLQAEILNQDPPVVRISGLLSPGDCQHIINLSRPQLSSSTMIVENKEVVNRSRSSKSAYITKNGQLPTNDAVIHRFLTRCSIISGVPISHFEGMKVVNYQKGQEYKEHHDYFRNHDKFIGKSGDRMMTFFVYLNTLEESDGGCTAFPKLGIKSRPKVGDAVFWTDMDFKGNYFDKTLHAGEPVLGDVEKWGINVWVRQNSY